MEREWEHLRVEGKPLLSVAAFGATPLLWAACRAQPCMVHVFCDAHLQDVWRFPADPVFLLIGSESRLQSKDERAHQRNGRLLVITRDGCVWIVPLSKRRTNPSRPSKKQKKATLKVGEVQRIQPPLVKRTTISEAVQSQKSTESFSTCWKELSAETYDCATSSGAMEVKNVVVAEALLGTVPGATVAAFGPDNNVVHVVKNVVLMDPGGTESVNIACDGQKEIKLGNSKVALGSPLGPPELLNNTNRLAASNFLSSPEGSESRTAGPVCGGGPTCLLVVSSVRRSQSHGAGDSQADLSNELFESLSSPSAGASDPPEILLIQGGMDGKIRTFHMQKDTILALPPCTVFDLQQPIVMIIPVSHPSTKTRQECDGEVRGANWLVVIGLLGQVAFLSSIRDQPLLQEPNDSPFRARRVHTAAIRVDQSTLRVSVILKKLVSSEGGALKGPITSACLVGEGRLCYAVGSAVFVTGNFASMVDADENSKWPSQRISVCNVAAIAGPGLFSYHGTHSLVALTGGGRLFSIKTSQQISSAAESSETSSGKSVKVLLQSIADAESCRDAIQAHDQALTLAMNELAVALPTAHDITTNNDDDDDTSLACTLTATPLPSPSLADRNHLRFGAIGTLNPKPSHRHSPDTNAYKTRLDIALTNHTKAPLSQHWSFILELRSCLSPTSIPSSQHSFVINNGHGLPAGIQWNHRVHVSLPGGPWGPVVATMYLCHVHDAHKALLGNYCSGNFEQMKLGRAAAAATASAGCVVIRRQRIDLFELLQGPKVTLGHTSWTPAGGSSSSSGNVNLKGNDVLSSSIAGTEGIEMLDLADSDTLGSFSGDLACNFSLDLKHANIGRTINGAADWQNGFLRQLLQQPSASTEWKRLRLTSPGGGAVAVSIDGRAPRGGTRCQSAVKIQAPSLLLGILFREALLSQLMDLGDGSREGQVLLHSSNEKTRLVTRLNEAGALAQRAREALNLWKEFRSHSSPPARDLVVPLLGHTYVVAAELIRAYKTFREEPPVTP